MHPKPYFRRPGALHAGPFPGGRAGLDPVLRIVGLCLLAIAGFAFHQLFHRIHTDVAHATTIGGMLIGATGFASASLGAAMAMLGGHLLDPVRISGRWQGRDGD